MFDNRFSRSELYNGDECPWVTISSEQLACFGRGTCHGESRTLGEL